MDYIVILMSGERIYWLRDRFLYLVGVIEKERGKKCEIIWVIEDGEII